MRVSILVAAAALVMAPMIAGPLLAEEAKQVRLSHPLQANWLTLSEVARKVESAGYALSRIETRANAIRIEGIDAKGKKVQGIVNPETGEIERVWGRE